MESGLKIRISRPKFLSALIKHKTCNVNPQHVAKGSSVGNKGFTLTEVLVALTLLAIGVMAVVTMFTVAMSANLKASRFSVANNLGQAALEDILAKDISDPIFSSNATATYDLDPNSSATSLSVKGAGTYNATYSITLGTNTNSICTGNAMVSVIISGTGITSMTFSSYKRLI